MNVSLNLLFSCYFVFVLLGGLERFSNLGEIEIMFKCFWSVDMNKPLPKRIRYEILEWFP